MKYFALFLLAMNVSSASSVISLKEAKELAKISYENVDSKVYESALKYINKGIIDCSKNNMLDNCLLNIDGKVYGSMFDAIEEYLKKLGYKVKWNFVGGIPGTSYRSFLQISY